MRISDLQRSPSGICYMVYEDQQGKMTFSSNFAFDALEAMRSLPDIGAINFKTVDIETDREGEDEAYKRYTEPDLTRIASFKKLISFLEEFADESVDDLEFYINKLEIEGNQFEIVVDDAFFEISYNLLLYKDFSIAKLIQYCLTFTMEVSEELFNKLKANPGKFLIVDRIGRVLEIWDKFDGIKFHALKPEDYK